MTRYTKDTSVSVNESKPGNRATEPAVRGDAA